MPSKALTKPGTWRPKKKLSGRQLKVLTLFMQSRYTIAEIAKISGYSHTHIDRILASPASKRRIQKWRESMRSRALKLMDRSIDVIEQELINGPEKLVAVEKAIKLYKLTHPEENPDDSAYNTTINIFARLRDQIADARAAQALEGEFVVEPDVEPRDGNGTVGDSPPSP